MLLLVMTVARAVKAVAAVQVVLEGRRCWWCDGHQWCRMVPAGVGSVSEPGCSWGGFAGILGWLAVLVVLVVQVVLAAMAALGESGAGGESVTRCWQCRRW